MKPQIPIKFNSELERQKYGYKTPIPLIGRSILSWSRQTRQQESELTKANQTDYEIDKIIISAYKDIHYEMVSLRNQCYSQIKRTGCMESFP